MYATNSNAKDAVLVVEDEPIIARSIVRALQPLFATQQAETVAESIALIGSGVQHVGAVVDIGLPDGTGLEVLEAFRQTNPTSPMLALTGDRQASTINTAHRLAAEYVCKPDYSDNLRRFVCRLATVDKKPISSRIDQFATNWQLTQREMQLLVLACDGTPRERLAEVLGVSENTVKSQIRSLLKKSQTPTLAEAMWKVRCSR